MSEISNKSSGNIVCFVIWPFIAFRFGDTKEEQCGKSQEETTTTKHTIHPAFVEVVFS